MTSTAAVYTGIFGGYDLPSDPVPQSIAVDWVSFGVDAPGWTRRRLPVRHGMTNELTARAAKILSCEWLYDYDYTIYIDGLIRIKSSAEHFAKWCIDSLGDSDILVYSHSYGVNIYKEIMNSRNARYGIGCDEIELAYRRYGIAESLQSISGNIIVRRRSDKLRAMEHEWFSHNTLWCRNDQISLPVAAQMHGIDLKVVPESIWNSPLFTRTIHPPSGYTEITQFICDRDAL